MPPTATAAIQALRAEGPGCRISTVQCSCPNPPPAEQRLTGADSAPFDNDPPRFGTAPRHGLPIAFCGGRRVRRIGGFLTSDSVAALYGRDRYRPLDRETSRAAAIELRQRGLTAHDISQALSLSLGAVLDLLGETARAVPETNR